MAAGHAKVAGRRHAPGLGARPLADTPSQTPAPARRQADPEVTAEVAAGAGVWRPWGAWLLSLLGTGVSLYLTIAHFSSSSILACSEQGIVNCEKVTTSPQSELFGHVPVAVLGLAYFLAMTALNVPPLWRVADRRVHLIRLALSVGGVAFVLYLLSAELLIIGNICLWCTSVHVITFLLFVVTVSAAPAMLGWGTET